MTDEAERTSPEASSESAGGAMTRGSSSSAAAAATGDNADAGEWPDDIASDRGSSSQSDIDDGGPPDVAIPQPEQAPMDDDAGGPTVPSTSDNPSG